MDATVSLGHLLGHPQEMSRFWSLNSHSPQQKSLGRFLSSLTPHEEQFVNSLPLVTLDLPLYFLCSCVVVQTKPSALNRSDYCPQLPVTCRVSAASPPQTVTVLCCSQGECSICMSSPRPRRLRWDPITETMTGNYLTRVRAELLLRRKSGIRVRKSIEHL